MFRYRSTQLVALALCCLGLSSAACADEIYGDLIIPTRESRVIDDLDVYGSIDNRGRFAVRSARLG